MAFDFSVAGLRWAEILNVTPNPSQLVMHSAATNIMHICIYIYIYAILSLATVCFDTFDPDEIWAQALKERRAAANVGGIKGDGGGGGGPPPPGVPRGFGGNRWQRGVALPPSESRGGGRSASAAAGSDPDDLWDDPADGPTSAASDFSAFGGSLDDVPRAGGSSSSGLGASGFDLSDMSEAAKRFEEELHGKDGKGGLLLANSALPVMPMPTTLTLERLTHTDLLRRRVPRFAPALETTLTSLRTLESRTQRTVRRKPEALRAEEKSPPVRVLWK